MNEPESDRQGFWEELKRRHVVKVGAAYAAAAFVVLQLAEIVIPALGLPEWALTLVVVLSAVGFPVAILLSWAFDLTPEGVRRTHDHGVGSPFGPGRTRVIQLGALATALFVLSLAGLWTVRRGAGGATDTRPASIAVLPFIDLSPEGDQAYLGDGMAEEVLNLLTRLEGLRVAARTSAFVFRGDEVDIREVGNTLSVAHVLEGSVRKDQDQVRITAQLIDVETGFHVWSETYQRTLASVFEVQDEIARVIVAALRGTLTPSDEARLGRAEGTKNAEAYEAYLRGREQWNLRSEEGLLSAIDLFEEALGHDSTFAKAQAGLADAWALLPLVSPGAVSPDDAWARSEAAAARALAWDPTLAEAHASLGLIQGFRYRLEQGVARFDEAVALNPSYASARHWRSLLLSELGRHDEAVAEARVAHELDPLSRAIHIDLGYALLWAQRWSEASEVFGELTAMGDAPARAWFGLAQAALWSNDRDRFESALDRWAQLSAAKVDGFEAVPEAVWTSRSGESVDRDQLAAWMEQETEASAGARAVLAALAGDTALAWQWLERSRTDRSYADHFPAANPAFRALRDTPRFDRFLTSLRGS